MIYLSITPVSWLLAHGIVWALANYTTVIAIGVLLTIITVAIAFVYLMNARPN